MEVVLRKEIVNYCLTIKEMIVPQQHARMERSEDTAESGELDCN